MLSFASVAVAMSNFDFDVDMQVVTFWLGVERGGEFRYFRSDNFCLTEEMKQALVLTQPGDRIWIGNAHVSMPDGTERELAPSFSPSKIDSCTFMTAHSSSWGWSWSS